ncbi:plasmid partitioning protein RepB [Rhizobium sp. Root483D2]|uniref:plasmid partitioning protein RepB n=1 Tax=Rhizobium sp. Root483D2 TaxID=1736545 RepID=UPI0009EA46AF|nr:plasmid partitioning protein RepB [Rhizobium sp. Root483D2]
MKGRDILKGMLGAADNAKTEAPTGHAHRPTGAVRAMNLSLGKLGEEAAAAKSLRESMASGLAVVEVEPGLVEMSFIRDRIPIENDADFEILKLSIQESGQQVPILVRPHPTKSNMYQAAYGHRRLKAAFDLAIPVRAVVKNLTDEELVLAQGQENGPRLDLSFIERALFAYRMQQHGFDREMIAKALATDKPEISRLLQVAQTVDPEIILAVGPAPKVGRPRWLALADKLKDETLLRRAQSETRSSTFSAAETNKRFEQLWKSLEPKKSRTKDTVETVRTKKGLPVASMIHVKNAVRITVTSPDFADFLVKKMPALVADFETEKEVDARD